MKIRIITDPDLEIVAGWWRGHKMEAPLPTPLLPEGYMINDCGIDVAAGFLYLDWKGKWAMVEWMTTNPRMAYSRSLIECWKTLAGHMEYLARERGCQTVISMVAPGTGEERLFSKIGYQDCKGPAHKMFIKSLIPTVEEKQCPSQS